MTTAKKCRRIDPEDPVNQEIVRLYEKEGIPVAEIGRRIGLSNIGVYYRMVRLGVKARSSGSRGQGRFKWAKDNQLFPLTRLVHTAGRSKKTVLDTITRLGIEIKKQSNWEFVTEEEAQRVIQEANMVYRLEPVPWMSTGVSEGEMGWLGGIWDGEGTITLTFRATKRGPRWSEQITLGNTDLKMPDRVASILGRLKIDFHRGDNAPGPRGKRHVFRIGLRGCVSFWRFCREVGPFMVTKAERAGIMMEFTECQATNQGRDGFWKVAEEYAKRFASLPDAGLKGERTRSA